MNGNPHLVDDPGVRFGVGNAVVVVTLLGAAATHLGVDATSTLVVLVAGLASIGVPLRFTVGLGIAAWAMVTGFIENQFGVLTFSGPDVTRLAVLVVATVVVSRLSPRLNLALDALVR